MEGLFFNIDYGYLEGIARGYRSSLLSSAQYTNLTQCDNLDDIKLQLSLTDYGNFLSNHAGPLSTLVINSALSSTMYKQFNYLKSNASGTLSKFLDFISYSYMIDNTTLMITGTLHERDRLELLSKCHPLGYFPTLPTLSIASDIDSLYSTVLIDTPLAPFFKDCLSVSDLDDLNIEIIKNKLYKNYLESFYSFIKSEFLEPDCSIMLKLLDFEADKRVINITLNSLDSDIPIIDLFPSIGQLYPVSHQLLSDVNDAEQIKSIVENIYDYKSIFDSSSSKSIDDWFYQLELNYIKNFFTQQFTLSTIWNWLRAKEQEIRNITWIAECIAQNQKDRIDSYISVF